MDLLSDDLFSGDSENILFNNFTPMVHQLLQVKGFGLG